MYKLTQLLFVLVDEMIAEVDIDGDGRIDYDGTVLLVFTQNNVRQLLVSELPTLHTICIN